MKYVNAVVFPLTGKREKVDDKWLARRVWWIFHCELPGTSPTIHAIIACLRLLKSSVRLTSRQMSLVICAEECLKLGHHCYLSGASVSRITLPENVTNDRRWSRVVHGSFVAGMNVAKLNYDTFFGGRSGDAN